MFDCPEPKQTDPEQRTNGKIERLSCLHLCESLGLRLPLHRAKRGQVDDIQTELPGWVNYLDGIAIDCLKPRAEAFMPMHQFSKAAFKCRPVQQPLQTRC